jgi:hypothetical protein
VKKEMREKHTVMTETHYMSQKVDKTILQENITRKYYKKILQENITRKCYLAYYDTKGGQEKITRKG